MDHRQSRRLIFAAAALALAARLGFGFGYWTGKPLTHDEREYLSLAGSLSAGSGFTYSTPVEGNAPRFGRAPGYPALLALLRVDAGAASTPASVKIVQSVLGALAVLLMAHIAQSAAGSRAAAIAAVIAALYPPLVWMPSYVLSEALYLPLGLAAVVLLSDAVPTRVVAAGLLSGAAALVRPASLLFLPLALAWLARRQRWALVLAFTAAAGLTIGPWSVRNFREHGRFVLIASEGGVTFWTGNHPLARGEGDLAANPAIKRAEVALRAAHPGLTPEQLEPLYLRDALEHIRQRPGSWIALMARKAFYTLVPIGPSYTLHSTRYFLATVVPFALLTPLAIAGVVLIARTGRPPEALYLLAASVVLTSLIFFPQERFRLPVLDPLVIIAAAAAVGGVNRPDA